MVRGKGTTAAPKVKEYLAPSAVQDLRDEQKEINSVIREVESGAGAGTRGAVEVSALKRQSQAIDRTIEERTAPTARGIQKDKLLAEEKELEDQLSLGMPTRYEMAQPTKNPGAVRKHMEWDKRNAHLIRRYVEIQRILRPMEPKSIEVLRKDK